MGIKARRRQDLITRSTSWPKFSGRALGAQAIRTIDLEPMWVGQVSDYDVVEGEYYSRTIARPAEGDEHAQELVSGWKDRPVLVTQR